jgi:hypothetical protein
VQAQLWSRGVGISLHVAAEMFKSLATINILHVPYKWGVTQNDDVGMIGVPHLPAAHSLGQVDGTGGYERQATIGASRRADPQGGRHYYVTSTWYGQLTTCSSHREIVNRGNSEWLKIMARSCHPGIDANVRFKPMSSMTEQFAEHIS